MTNALGIAGATSGGLLEFARSGNGAMVKRLDVGRSAEGGVLAASLAAEGYTGPNTVLEGPFGFLKVFCVESDATVLTRGLGERFETMSIMMKRFACHITAHTAVEALLDLRRTHGFAASDIASIHVAGSERMATINNVPAPKDVMLAQFSIPFSVALAMYRDPRDPRSFDDAVVHDPQISALAQQVSMSAVSGQGPADVACTLSVTLRDGQVFETHVTDFQGTPEHPLDHRELREKFLLLTHQFGEKRMEVMFDRLQQIEREKTLDWVAL
jgi:2-methylcitrate dehydratase PrpD